MTQVNDGWFDSAGNPGVHALILDTSLFRENASSAGLFYDHDEDTPRQPVQIPGGSNVIGVEIDIRRDDGSKTLDLGWEGNGDGILDGYNVVAGVTQLKAEIASEDIGDPGELLQVYANMSSASTTLAGTVTVYYVTRKA